MGFDNYILHHDEKERKITHFRNICTNSTEKIIWCKMRSRDYIFSNGDVICVYLTFLDKNKYQNESCFVGSDEFCPLSQLFSKELANLRTSFKAENWFHVADRKNN